MNRILVILINWTLIILDLQTILFIVLWSPFNSNNYFVIFSTIFNIFIIFNFHYSNFFKLVIFEMVYYYILYWISLVLVFYRDINGGFIWFIWYINLTFLFFVEFAITFLWFIILINYLWLILILFSMSNLILWSWLAFLLIITIH